MSLRAKEAGFLNFLLIGKNVVIAFGVPRFTRDIDFVIPSDESREWRSSQRRNDAIDWNDVVELTRRWQLAPENDQGFIDLVLRYGGEDSLKRLKKDIADKSK